MHLWISFIRRHFHSSFSKHGGTMNLRLGVLLNFGACNREWRQTIFNCASLRSWKVISVLFYCIALHRSVPAEQQVLVYHTFRTCACCYVNVTFSFAVARTNRNTGHTQQRNNSLRAHRCMRIPCKDITEEYGASGKASDQHSGGSRFTSRPEHQLPRWIFVPFLRSSHVLGYCPRIKPPPVLSTSVRFILYNYSIIRRSEVWGTAIIKPRLQKKNPSHIKWQSPELSQYASGISNRRHSFRACILQASGGIMYLLNRFYPQTQRADRKRPQCLSHSSSNSSNRGEG